MGTTSTSENPLIVALSDGLTSLQALLEGIRSEINPEAQNIDTGAPEPAVIMERSVPRHTLIWDNAAVQEEFKNIRSPQEGDSFFLNSRPLVSPGNAPHKRRVSFNISTTIEEHLEEVADILNLPFSSFTTNGDSYWLAIDVTRPREAVEIINNLLAFDPELPYHSVNNMALIIENQTLANDYVDYVNAALNGINARVDPCGDDFAVEVKRTGHSPYNPRWQAAAYLLYHASTLNTAPLAEVKTPIAASTLSFTEQPAIVTTCIAYDPGSERFGFGFTRLHPDDDYDAEIGEAVAFRRALFAGSTNK